MLQPKLNLKVSQRQVLTPGLVQMVSVLALNKLELKEMINTEMVENPVLEEVDESAATIEEIAGREASLERSAEEIAASHEKKEKDPFDEVDFGSYFQDYLDPGYRTASNFEEIERPSFDNFLSRASTLTDHLEWQLGSMTLEPEVRLAADLVVGNLNEDGYLSASDEELVDALLEMRGPIPSEPIPFERGIKRRLPWEHTDEKAEGELERIVAESAPEKPEVEELRSQALTVVRTACELVQQLDPVGIGARDLRECLLIQISVHRRNLELAQRRAEAHRVSLAMEMEGLEADAAPQIHVNELHGAEGQGNHGNGTGLARPCSGSVVDIAAHIVANHLSLLQKKDMRELTRLCGRNAEEVNAAVDFIRTLDPRPGQRYNVSETRLIEPDVAFVKRDGEFVVLMNEEDMPTLRLSHAYRKMLREKGTEKDVREYVKERYKSAIQLLRNIEQRKNTIVRTCEVIVRRQSDFLERGEEALHPMMIKEVAEEIGVHPSTVSRAVANKYVHTPQGVYELRYFFTEGVNGPEGADLPLVLLKRKVKKLIEDEDSRKPLTDDQLAAELQRQGIKVTRRTVAKYREDMQIPSTHQRRVR